MRHAKQSIGWSHAVRVFRWSMLALLLLECQLVAQTKPPTRLPPIDDRSNQNANVDPLKSPALPKLAWEDEISAFEKQDQAMQPPVKGTLFVGSSSIRMWDLERSFPERGFLNRGFGGSTMADVVRLAHRVIFPYQPRLIVLYEGDNDIAQGVAPEVVVRQFEQLCERITHKSPTTQIIVLSIKPSVARWELYPLMQQANEGLKAYCDHHARCQFVDVGTCLLGDDGLPNPEYFVEDGLHLNAAGYARWARELDPFLNVP